MQAHRAAVGADSRVLFIVEKAKTADERRHAEALRVASLIRDEIVGKWRVHLGKDPSARETCGTSRLLPKRTGLAGLEKALGAASLRYRTLGGVGFYAQAEIKMLVAVLAWVANPGDEVSLLGMLRSPLFGMDDGLLAALRVTDAKVGLRRRFSSAHLADCAVTAAERSRIAEVDASLTRWWRLAASLPASSFLEVVIRETGARFSMGHADPSGRAEANMDLLLAKIRGLEEEGEGAYATLARAFVQSIEDDERGSQADPPIDGEAVTLMTIHGSKGLEFPIVVLFDMGSPPSGDEKGSPPPWVGRVEGRELTLVELPHDNGTGLHNLMKTLKSHKERAERARLLFVATTRAEDHLVITGSVKDYQTGEGQSVRSVRARTRPRPSRTRIADLPGRGRQRRRHRRGA
jgi:ATP-dependent helicase/nuclease subunit A